MGWLYPSMVPCTTTSSYNQSGASGHRDDKRRESLVPAEDMDAINGVTFLPEVQHVLELGATILMCLSFMFEKRGDEPKRQQASGLALLMRICNNVSIRGDAVCKGRL
jgi:hypothetical protein